MRQGAWSHPSDDPVLLALYARMHVYACGDATNNLAIVPRGGATVGRSSRGVGEGCGTFTGR